MAYLPGMTRGYSCAVIWEQVWIISSMPTAARPSRPSEGRETGCMEFEVMKGRFSFRLTAPCAGERRKAASGHAKQNGM